MRNVPFMSSHQVRARCSVFIATSLDGFIARRDGRVDLVESRSFESGLVQLEYRVPAVTVDRARPPDRR